MRNVKFNNKDHNRQKNKTFYKLGTKYLRFIHKIFMKRSLSIDVKEL